MDPNPDPGDPAKGCFLEDFNKLGLRRLERQTRWLPELRSWRNARVAPVLTRTFTGAAGVEHPLTIGDRWPSYPHEELDRNWQSLLLNQFHGILPGSSINEVYLDTHRELRAVVGTATALCDTAITTLSREG